jgi:hypothetical protein
MENVKADLEIRSEEVQEIIGQVPGGLIRWGITVIFLVMLALLGVNLVYKIPRLAYGTCCYYHHSGSGKLSYPHGWSD